MKTIPLTNSHKVALVDDDDFEKVRYTRWYYNRGYAQKTIYVNGKSHCVKLHRFLLNVPPDKEVDHINHNRLDCQKANLRLATHSQNQMNSRLSSRNTSGYRGVCFHKKRGTWTAQIFLSNNHYYLGAFATAEEAARAYDAKAKELFREFAQLNFPEAIDG